MVCWQLCVQEAESVLELYVVQAGICALHPILIFAIFEIRMTSSIQLVVLLSWLLDVGRSSELVLSR